MKSHAIVGFVTNLHIQYIMFYGTGFDKKLYAYEHHLLAYEHHAVVMLYIIVWKSYVVVKDSS